jgi:zeaxanthin glucosyltransferase
LRKRQAAENHDEIETMRIAFVAVSAPGHLNPTTALARKLQARGHDVVLTSLPDAEPYANAAGLPFVPFGEEDYPAGTLPKIAAELSKLKGQDALEFTLRAGAKILLATFADLPRSLRETRADALVIDHALQTAGLVPMHLDLPFVNISNALHLDFSGVTPLNIFAWPHETTPEARARNEAGVSKYLQSLEPISAITREYAEKNGLKVDWKDPYATTSKLAWLTQVPREFDFPSDHWPSSFHHTGPFHDGEGRVSSEFPWERLTGEPMIYASMGTLQNGLEPVFSTIAEAVGKSAPAMQLVLSIGSSLDPKQIRSLPANAIVVQNAPQVALLKRASLCITHAGLNTVLESLTQGVPMVAIPITNDQPGVAARIASTKTGKFVPVQELTTERLSALIDEVLRNTEYRKNALTMKRTIERTDGMNKAADLIEEAFGQRRVTTREVAMSAD